MAYTDDWESLMNGVFGAGGRVKFGSGAAQPDTKAKTGGLPDLNAALLEQQKQLDELLKKQNAQLKKQDADTQTALENSRQMLRDMENDGLLAKGTADTKPEHLGSFEGLAAEVKKAFNERFFDRRTLKYDRNSQAANAMALYMGLVEPQYEEVVLKNLIDDIRGRGNAVTAGDIGYRYVVQTLQDRGASDVLFDMNTRYDVPGYGYQIAMGETALAESWQSRDYLSHNHCMLGHLYSWLFSGIGGISQESGSTAYKRIVIDPQIVGDLRDARVSFRSPYGLIRSEWKDAPDEFVQTIEIPANATARICLPATDPAKVTESGKPVSGRKDMAVESGTDGRIELHVGSGVYRIAVEK